MSDSAEQKNILAVLAYSKETRKLFRALEQKFEQISAQQSRIDMLETQVQNLQVALHSGGSTDGG